MVEASRALQVLGRTPFPVELIDGQAHVRYCNPAYSRVFALGAEEILDRASRVLPVQWAGRPRSAVLEAAVEGQSWAGEAVTGTGVKAWVTLFALPVPGEPPAFAVYYEFQDTRSPDLLSLAAHQWRQPLTVAMSVIGAIQLKSELGTLEPAVLTEKLDRVAQTLQFLSATIETFRGLSQPTKERTSEDLIRLVRETVELLQPGLENSGVRLSIAEGAVGLAVYRGEFQQLALELINRVARGGGAVAVEVRRTGGEVELLVHRDRPLEPGSDVPVARLIAEGHGGRLQSEVDGYRVFFPVLP